MILCNEIIWVLLMPVAFDAVEFKAKEIKSMKNWNGEVKCCIRHQLINEKFFFLLCGGELFCVALSALGLFEASPVMSPIIRNSVKLNLTSKRILSLKSNTTLNIRINTSFLHQPTRFTSTGLSSSVTDSLQATFVEYLVVLFAQTV